MSKELQETLDLKLTGETPASTESASRTVTLSERRPDSDPDCRRKHARKSRLYVKDERSPELSCVGKTAPQHYHRPPTPDTSPIRLLPFSPSQVSCLSIFLFTANQVMSIIRPNRYVIQNINTSTKNDIYSATVQSCPGALTELRK